MTFVQYPFDIHKKDLKKGLKEGLWLALPFILCPILISVCMLYPLNTSQGSTYHLHKAIGLLINPKTFG